MKTNYLLTVIITLFATSGCYLPMTGMVVDAETNQPIEGAVLLVEWTKTNVGGGADPYTTSYKVGEAVSDKDGKVKMPGCWYPFANEPDVTVYKKGYVAWNNKFIFPDYKKRKDFRYGGDAFRLERFKSIYSYSEHTSFLRHSIGTSLNIKEKLTIYDAIDWEDKKALEERQRR